jgi:hypothetical protein
MAQHAKKNANLHTDIWHKAALLETTFSRRSKLEIRMQGVAGCLVSPLLGRIEKLNLNSCCI